MTEKYFFRFYEPRKEFRFLIHIDSQKNKMTGDLSACITEKFAGYLIVRSKCENKERILFTRLDITFDAVKDKSVNCYFLIKNHFVYKLSFMKSDKTKHSRELEYYHCSNSFVNNNKYEKYIKNCSGIPGVLHKLDKLNIVTFENDLKYRGNLPFVAYCDFEITTTSESAFDLENCKMFAVCYVIIFAFHPALNLDRIIVERNFGCSLQKLVDVNYLKCDIISFADATTMQQLKDYPIRASQKNYKQVISEIFSNEIKFVADCVMRWFKRKKPVIKT